jgi:hypothetical protein
MSGNFASNVRCEMSHVEVVVYFEISPEDNPPSERRGARRAGWSLTNQFDSRPTTPALRATPPVPGGEFFYLLSKLGHYFFKNLEQP